MLKNKFLLGSVLAAFVFGTQVSTVNALELDEDTRTVVLDSKGNTVVLTPEQVKRGKRLFNNACGTCHVGGVTKTGAVPDRTRGFFEGRSWQKGGLRCLGPSVGKSCVVRGDV